MTPAVMTLAALATGLIILTTVWAIYERNVRKYWQRIGRDPDTHRDPTAPRPLTWTLKRWAKEKKKLIAAGKNPFGKKAPE